MHVITKEMYKSISEKIEKVTNKCEFLAFEYNLFNQEPFDNLNRYIEKYKIQFSKKFSCNYYHDLEHEKEKKMQQCMLLDWQKKSENFLHTLIIGDEDAIYEKFISQRDNFSIVSLSSAKIHARTQVFLEWEWVLKPVLMHKVSGLLTKEEEIIIDLEQGQKGDVKEAYQQTKEYYKNRLPVFDSLDSIVLEELLFIVLGERNLMMSKAINRFIQKNPGKKFLANIGISHFEGKHGILSLLEDKGYTLIKKKL
jgi:hypothetical protein